VFPTEGGDAGEFERHGMVGALQDLLAAGRIKLYCVDSFDRESWSNSGVSLEERARRHGAYEAWILGEVVPFIRDDCGGASEVITCGASLGAFHAANFARGQLSVLLTCGQGQWEDTTGALDSSRHFASLLQRKGIRCELDVWGHDVAHDWPWWRTQLAHHLRRLC